jgi:hypothetical protein
MNKRDHEEIPEELTRGAFRNGEEFAWKQEDCARVIEWLRGGGIAVLGMELWLPDGQNIRTGIKTKTGPVVIYCSACNPLKAERWGDCVDRSAKSTMGAIASFRWPEDAAEPPRRAYFNITWASRQWFREHSRDNFAED